MGCAITHTPTLVPHLSPAVGCKKGPADVSALFMQIPFCSSVTMEYCSLLFTLYLPYALYVCLASISRISLAHYLLRPISDTLFPPLFTVFSKIIQTHTQPTARSRAVRRSSSHLSQNAFPSLYTRAQLTCNQYSSN